MGVFVAGGARERDLCESPLGAGFRGAVAFLAGDRRVPRREEFGPTGMRVVGHAESPRRVALLAGGPELAPVDVRVARRAIGPGSAEIDRGRASGALRRGVLVARRAGDLRVPSVERELRARGVVERGLPEAVLPVAGSAVLLEHAAMGIPVAIRAAGGRDPDFHRALDMAFRAGHGRVRPEQRIPRLPVIDLFRPEGRGRVARLAGAERLAVRVAVAVGARGELLDLPGAGPVTALALEGGVSARERKSGLRVVEAAARLLERDRRGMAARAIGAQRAAVRVGVARRATGRGGEVRPRLVAARARKPGVLSLERKAGVLRVVEGLRVEARDRGVGAGVLDVAGNAAFAGGSVNSLSGRDPFGDRPMAGEAFRGRDLS